VDGRVRTAGAIAVGVLLLHLAALSLVDRAPGRGWQAQPPRALRVRQLPLPTRDAAAQVAPAPQTAAVPARRAERHAAVEAAVPAPVVAESSKADVPPETPTEPGGLQVPVYATQLPPPVRLRFESRRGVNSGVAELAWERSGEGYRLALQGQALGAPFIGWASSGGYDAAGLAPVRYAETRRGREIRAVNFQRDSGRVTFSGPSIEHPLVPGMQDRLSWLVQLAGVLQAQPELGLPGAQVLMAVVGTRGDAEVWTFSVQDRGALELPAGVVPDAVHLLREPRRPYDTQVQVWLDPARGHLPVQAFLRIRATGEGTELRLLEATTP
jgi:hypothetical protein